MGSLKDDLSHFGSLAASGKDEPEADIFFEDDIYDMVVVAAFGGIEMNLDGDKVATIHPFLIFMLSLPLWVMQVSALTYLRLDMDVLAGVQKEEDGETLITLKILMVLVLQLMLFKELLGSVSLMTFVVNPRTWTDIKRKSGSELKGYAQWLYWGYVLFPLSFIAQMFKFTIAYFVCLDSVSVVLECRSVKDAIFDCLAITFISDLDETVWIVGRILFRWQKADKGDWKFKLWNEESRKEAVKSGPWRESILRPLKFLRRGFGGQKTELIITFVAMLSIYIRQLFVVLFALKTNILPVARDVCSMYRWHHSAWYWLDFKRSVVEMVLRVVPGRITKQLTELASSMGYCDEHDGLKFGRMKTSHTIALFKEYIEVCIPMIAAMIAILLAPAFSRWILDDNGTKIPTSYEALTAAAGFQGDSEAPKKGEASESRASAEPLLNEQPEMAAMREQLTALQAEMAAMREQMKGLSSLEASKKGPGESSKPE
ncbi:unnamed protein product [Polarella glacialis]|uniref:Uncharacterized protein n=1 Tax=Polarella glacialis TaxID=89957 RepID=A0A813FZ87_POLGL|nr:unnamed protein product [Polarella glacialis]CAE8712411.1 unnamed protein product [Polarella glacialis]CAE8717061.1 unnamed protein product [Polarella glacialis]